MTPAPLPRDFYGPSAAVVAPALLGHWLLRREPTGAVLGGRIVETEAYLCADDPACHAARGRTARNAAMWGPPGHAYVYFIYGVHHCFNAVCQPDGVAEAVLVRAITVERGGEALEARRPNRRTRDLTNGPGKLCAALAIDRTVDGVDLCDVRSPVWIGAAWDSAAFCASQGPVERGPRIGISQAAELPLRFYLAGSPFVSRR